MPGKYYNMETSPSTDPRQILQSIRIVFYAIVAGLFMFILVMFGLGRAGLPAFGGRSLGDALLIVILFAGAIIISFAEKSYKKRIAAAQATGLTLTDKLNRYRGALIFFLAICEGLGLFASIIYFLTHDERFLAVAGIILLGLLLKRPQKSRIFKELQLSSMEQLELN